MKMRGGMPRIALISSRRRKKNVVKSDDTPSAWPASIMFWQAWNRLTPRPPGISRVSRSVPSGSSLVLALHPDAALGVPAHDDDQRDAVDVLDGVVAGDRPTHAVDEVLRRLRPLGVDRGERLDHLRLDLLAWIAAVGDDHELPRLGVARAARHRARLQDLVDDVAGERSVVVDAGGSQRVDGVEHGHRRVARPTLPRGAVGRRVGSVVAVTHPPRGRRGAGRCRAARGGGSVVEADRCRASSSGAPGNVPSACG